MTIHTICNYLIIAGSIAFGLIPLDKKRIHAPWAKRVFIIAAIIGVIDGSVELAWDMDWFSLSSGGSRLLEAVLHMVGGLVLGFIFSLILSGQLLGTKQPPNNSLQPTPGGASVSNLHSSPGVAEL